MYISVFTLRSGRPSAVLLAADGPSHLGRVERRPRSWDAVVSMRVAVWSVRLRGADGKKKMLATGNEARIQCLLCSLVVSFTRLDSEASEG
jgi:hypothetical protein